MRVFDHNELGWKSRAIYTSGALTYSKDIVKYQIPYWQEVLYDEDVLATCGKLSDLSVPVRCSTAIQYLHSWPYYTAVERIQQIQQGIKAKNVVFITAYKKFQETLKLYDIKSVFIPMAIDVEKIRQHKKEPTKEGFIYYGNVITDKIGTFNALKAECQGQKIPFDYISFGKFNGEREVNQEEALDIVAQYKYGIGVGRCAQEMYALGLKVLIAGKNVGGLITNEQEYEKQLQTNMNSRIFTFSNDIYRCISNIDESLSMANDITKLNHVEIYNDQFGRANSQGS